MCDKSFTLVDNSVSLEQIKFKQKCGKTPKRKEIDTATQREIVNEIEQQKDRKKKERDRYRDTERDRGRMYNEYRISTYNACFTKYSWP